MDVWDFEKNAVIATIHEYRRCFMTTLLNSVTPVKYTIF